MLTLVQMYIYHSDVSLGKWLNPIRGKECSRYHVHVWQNRIYWIIDSVQRWIWAVELNRTFFFSPFLPTKLNSLSPSGAICVTVTHELSLPLLTSGFWVRHDSRATTQARITPKTSAAPSCLRERGADRCCSFALWTTSVETFCLDRPTMHKTRKRPRSKAVCQNTDTHR